MTQQIDMCYLALGGLLAVLVAPYIASRRAKRRLVMGMLAIMAGMFFSRDIPQLATIYPDIQATAGGGVLYLAAIVLMEKFT